MSTNIWNKQSEAWRIHCQSCVQWSIHYYRYKRYQGKENLGKIYLKEKEKNSQPLPANWTEDLQIFDANCDDNGDFISILISLDGLQCIYSGHIIYVCQHFYLRKGISATLNSFFFRFSNFIL